MPKSKEVEFKSKEVEKFFKGLRKNQKDIEKRDRVFWGSLSSIAFKDVMDHFDKEKGPSAPWIEWSDFYFLRMLKKGKAGNKILQDTGVLRNSTSFVTDQGRIRKGFLLWNPATSKKGEPYAYNHDTGSGGMPQREFMWLSLKAIREMAKVTSEYMLGEK